MKHVEAGLSAREDRESNCGSPVKLMQACLCAETTRFHLRGGTVKHVQASLTARDGRESSFRHCGGRVRLVQASLCAGKT